MSSGVSASLVNHEGKASESGSPGSSAATAPEHRAEGLELPFEGADYEESFLLADVRLAWERPDDEITITLIPEGPLVAFPFHEPGRCRLVHASSKPVDPSQAEPGRLVRLAPGDAPRMVGPRRS